MQSEFTVHGGSFATNRDIQVRRLQNQENQNSGKPKFSRKILWREGASRRGGKHL
jgi:hypothetical protein